jgi:hypothetical protein
MLSPVYPKRISLHGWIAGRLFRRPGWPLGVRSTGSPPAPPPRASGSQPPAAGGFLFRLANFFLFLHRRQLRKNKKCHAKALAERSPNPGSFWFTAVGGSFFWRRKDFRAASLGSEWQKTAHMKLILCVSSKLFYSSGMQRLHTAISASKHLPNSTCWRAGAWPVCVTDLVGGSSLDAVKTSPKNAC